jgi:hypothetical protein
MIETPSVSPPPRGYRPGIHHPIEPCLSTLDAIIVLDPGGDTHGWTPGTANLDE